MYDSKRLTDGEQVRVFFGDELETVQIWTRVEAPSVDEVIDDVRVTLDGILQRLRRLRSSLA